MYQSLVRNIWMSQLPLNYVVVTIPSFRQQKFISHINALGVLQYRVSQKVSPTRLSDWSELNWTDSSLAKASRGQTRPQGRRSVMPSKDEQLGKDLAREGQQIFWSSPYLLQCIFWCSHFTGKSPRVFFEGYLFGGGAGMFATCIFKHLDSVNWLS